MDLPLWGGVSLVIVINGFTTLHSSQPPPLLLIVRLERDDFKAATSDCRSAILDYDKVIIHNIRSEFARQEGLTYIESVFDD